HERGRVRIQVMRTSGVKVRIAGGADVHHGGNVQLYHLLVERIPLPVGQRRRGPVAARGGGIQGGTDEDELAHAALEFGRAVDGWNPRRLRQLANTNEIVWIERADAVDQIVADAAPASTGRLPSQMVSHGRGARREDRHVGAALTLQLELRLLEAV